MLLFYQIVTYVAISWFLFQVMALIILFKVYEKHKYMRKIHVKWIVYAPFVLVFYWFYVYTMTLFKAIFRSKPKEE